MALKNKVILALLPIVLIMVYALFFIEQKPDASASPETVLSLPASSVKSSGSSDKNVALSTQMPQQQLTQTTSENNDNQLSESSTDSKGNITRPLPGGGTYVEFSEAVLAETKQQQLQKTHVMKTRKNP